MKLEGREIDFHRLKPIRGSGMDKKEWRVAGPFLSTPLAR